MVGPGRFAVTGYDVASVGIDVMNGKLGDAGVTAGSLAVSSAVEKGLMRVGVPGSAAGRLGAVAGSVYDQIAKIFGD